MEKTVIRAEYTYPNGYMYNAEKELNANQCIFRGRAFPVQLVGKRFDCNQHEFEIACLINYLGFRHRQEWREGGDKFTVRQAFRNTFLEAGLERVPEIDTKYIPSWCGGPVPGIDPEYGFVIPRKLMDLAEEIRKIAPEA